MLVLGPLGLFGLSSMIAGGSALLLGLWVTYLSRITGFRAWAILVDVIYYLTVLGFRGVLVGTLITLIYHLVIPVILTLNLLTKSP